MLGASLVRKTGRPRHVIYPGNTRQRSFQRLKVPSLRLLEDAMITPDEQQTHKILILDHLYHDCDNTAV